MPACPLPCAGGVSILRRIPPGEELLVDYGHSYGARGSVTCHSPSCDWRGKSKNFSLMHLGFWQNFSSFSSYRSFRESSDFRYKSVANRYE